VSSGESGERAGGREREWREGESKGGMADLRETMREGEAAASERWRGKETG
jgi:hypothetical protein